jgi:hypothetical protein
MLKRIGAVLAGLIAGTGVVFINETISARIFPLPPGTKMSDLISARAAMESMPVGAYLLVLFGWLVGLFVAVTVTSRIATESRGPGWTTGGILLCSTLMNMYFLPHPIWMWAAVLVLFPATVYATFRATARSS